MKSFAGQRFFDPGKKEQKGAISASVAQARFFDLLSNKQ